MQVQSADFKRRWQKRQRSLCKRGVDRSYLYAHLEADTGNIFYIGMGKTPSRPWDMSDRSEEHRERAENHGLKVSIITDSIHNWHVAGWWERWWIAACREAGIDLVNLAGGGEGAGVVHESTREKLRKINTGKKYSPETNAKKGRAGEKLTLTDEGRAVLKKPKSEETKEKMRLSALNLPKEKKRNQREGCLKFLENASQEWLDERSRRAREARTAESIKATIKKGLLTKAKNKELYGEDYYKPSFAGPKSPAHCAAIKAACWARPTHWSNKFTTSQIFEIGTRTASVSELCRQFGLSDGTVKDIQIYVASLLGVPPRHKYPKLKLKAPSLRKGLGSGTHMKLEEYKRNMRGDRNVSKRPEVVEKIKKGNSRHSTQMWADPSYRNKMLLRDWYNSCVRDKLYWGA